MHRKILATATLTLLLGCTASSPDQGGSTILQLSDGRSIDFGNDRGEYPRDGECDDPRFVGQGMATSLDNANIRGDASDCQRHFQSKNIRLVRTRSQVPLSQCRSIDYGNNSSQWSRDGECDDPRFTGPGVDNIMLINDLRADATDCRRLCDAGQVWLK